MKMTVLVGVGHVQCGHQFLGQFIVDQAKKLNPVAPHIYYVLYKHHVFSFNIFWINAIYVTSP